MPGAGKALFQIHGTARTAGGCGWTGGTKTPVLSTCFFFVLRRAIKIGPNRPQKPLVGQGLCPAPKEGTQQHTWSDTVFSCTLLLAGWNKLHAGCLSFPQRSLLGRCLVQRIQLPIMEPIYQSLDRQNGVPERAVALESGPGDGIGGLCGDETVLPSCEQRSISLASLGDNDTLADSQGGEVRFLDQLIGTGT